MIDLTDESKWVQREASLREVTYINGTSEYVPLIDRLILYTFTGRYIRVLMQYNSAPPTWYLGGRLSIKTNTNDVSIPTNVQKALVRRVSIPLNRATIVEIPDFLPEYRLSFQPPLWFIFENLRIWEYVG